MLMYLFRLLKQLPVQLLLAITFAFAIGQVAPLSYVRFSYTVSACFIDTIFFFLPLMVFSFIFRALNSMKGGSVSLVLLIFLGVTISNCLALTTGYICGQLFLPLIGVSHTAGFMPTLSVHVEPFFRLHLPRLLGTETALLAGCLAGIACNWLSPASSLKQWIDRRSEKLNEAIGIFLSRLFIPLLPLYVLGFCAKLSYEGALSVLFEHYGKVFVFSLCIVAAYLSLLFFIGAKGSWKVMRENMKQMLPAGLMGFSTMSSAATMPVTLDCVEKVTKDRELTRLVVPSTANIHMLGDDVTIVIASLTLLSVFGMPWPEWSTFLPFMLAFSFAKLSCVGIPGASVLVVLPVLQSYFGFTPEMVSMLTTIYVLQDPFGTASNVMGNGAFAVLIKRLRVGHIQQDVIS